MGILCRIGSEAYETICMIYNFACTQTAIPPSTRAMPVHVSSKAKRQRKVFELLGLDNILTSRNHLALRVPLA